jgi:NMD protein affecting ribosome stability and mRNA decay
VKSLHSALPHERSTRTWTSRLRRLSCRSLHVEREVPLTKPYITCQQLIDFIAQYRDQELSSHERVEFERHLAVCPSCVAYLRTYEQTVLLAKASAGDPVPEEIPEPLVKAILEARRKPEA